MPMIGAKSKLLAKVPFSITSVAGPQARKPRRQMRDVKVSAVVAPGRERRVEAVDAIAELLVVRDEARAGEVELEKLGVAVALPDVDVADRRAGVVAEVVAAVDQQPALLREQLRRRASPW